MKTLFVCYALERSHITQLRERLTRIDEGALAAGWRSYAHVRDDQRWQFHNASIRDVLDVAFTQLAAADAVLLDLTSHTNSKRVGLNIEAGYAKALMKPILALYRGNDRPNMTTDLADYEASYNQMEELPDIVGNLLTRVSVPQAAQS